VRGYRWNVEGGHGILGVVSAKGLPGFAVAVYRRDGVSAACLHLQERFDADVNLVLCAAFTGAVRRHDPTESEVVAMREAVAPWHTEIVVPLRAVRRRLRTGPPPAPDDATTELRARIQRDEIEAELIELGVLDGLVATFSEGEAAGDDESICRAIGRVLPPLAAADGDAVAVIAAAARAERGHA